MSSQPASCVVGIDVGGTNTDAVILQGGDVLAWHKTPTTSNIQVGVELAIVECVKKAKIPSSRVESVKIGTTQFINAVLEQDASKLDRVAVIRLCGQYSRGSPPFVGFPSTLRNLVEGYSGYVDGGFQVDGTPIAVLSKAQLKEQAAIIRVRRISSVVVIGIYSPSNPKQEEDARCILAEELGPGFDISCSHAVGRLGFLERENASILNASLRRFARHVIAGFAQAVQKLGHVNLYITLNDGTLSRATTAAEYPVRCFSCGPTNSARGAALLSKISTADSDDTREILVVDVGGTSTDVCSLLKSGYPRQSAAFVKLAGVRTNFTIPDVHSIALGGGSLVRLAGGGRISIGPDSVGARLEQEAITFGGTTVTATDLILPSAVSLGVKLDGLAEIQRALEQAVDLVKTQQGDARLILVGGGSIIVGNTIAGVGEIIRPKYFEVANAVGAAIGKISGTVDTMVIPGTRTIEQEIEAAKLLAHERCVAAGGDGDTIEIVDIETIPLSYITNGATRLAVRVVGDLLNYSEELNLQADQLMRLDGAVSRQISLDSGYSDSGFDFNTASKGSSYEVSEPNDLESYRPHIKGDVWYLSETDINFLMDGTGILGVGSCGEPFPAYLSCLQALREGKQFKIFRQSALADDAVILSVGFIGSPSVYHERVAGVDEITDAMKAVMKATNLTTFDGVIPNEIGGLNAFEALLAGHRMNKPTLDTDCVARAYPMVWQTVRCLNKVPVTPAAVADGCGRCEVFKTSWGNDDAERLMRNASIRLGSFGGMCCNPLTGLEAKALPSNSFSHAWSIGRSIALSRSRKVDPIPALLATERGTLVFTGKIVSVDRHVSEGFVRGSVLLDSISGSENGNGKASLYVEFENENLSATRKVAGEEDEIVAVCPDLITFLDIANGAPLGIADYKYGLRVSVIALQPPPVWLTGEGLKMGGPRAFGLDMEYKGVAESDKSYKAPKSVWDLYPEIPE